MRVYRYALLMFVFLFSSVSLEAIEKERVVKKSFKVNDNTELKIKNSFGAVDVESYSGSEVFIEVKIWAKGRSANKVEGFINSIEIDFDVSSDEIEVETHSASNNGMVKSFRVDYTIKIPTDNYLKIRNSFGNVKIGNHKGVVVLDVSHGNIEAENIKNKNNEIELQFGNATINKYGSGEIELQHSNLSIESVLDLRLESEFSNTKIKELVRSVNAEVSHGSLKFGSINKRFESLKIKAEFSKINLEMDKTASYNLRYKGSFTSFSTPSEFEVTNRDKDYTSEEVEGIVNGGGALVELTLSHSTLNID